MDNTLRKEGAKNVKKNLVNQGWDNSFGDKDWYEANHVKSVPTTDEKPWSKMKSIFFGIFRSCARETVLTFAKA